MSKAHNDVSPIRKPRQSSSAAEPLPPAKSASRITGGVDITILLAFGFGVIFLGIMLGFAVGFPNPSPFQLTVFMTALSTAAAGIGAIIPGFLIVNVKNFVRAGGALGLFAVVWFSQPAIVRSVVTLEVPAVPAEPTVAKFLADLDKGDVEATYHDLDQISKNEMVPTQDLWQQIFDSNVKGLGNVQFRKLMGFNAASSPSGMPIGIYRQYNYLTKYSEVNGCRQEAVIVRATQEKQWRVYSYLISPATIECGPAPVSKP